ncbi:GrpB family protein [Lysinibacillus xylanilyticus]|uniref:GrpB family protein n=1 Tax=Lysinibacillus xylanilyticus TaxID=582475 RepID=UPI003CFBD01D
MKNIKVELSEYNPYWEEQFIYEKNRIVEALGNKVVGIEHIGSTSIRGLKAKPIIDILIGVQSLDEVPNFIDTLSEIDYEYVLKPELIDRRFFRKGLWGQGTSHLHICEFNSNEWNEKCLFRDYIRENPHVAYEYASLKEQLASEYEYDRITYTKEKEPFIKMIIAKAKTARI